MEFLVENFSWVKFEFFQGSNSDLLINFFKDKRYIFLIFWGYNKYENLVWNLNFFRDQNCIFQGFFEHQTLIVKKIIKDLKGMFKRFVFKSNVNVSEIFFRGSSGNFQCFFRIKRGFFDEVFSYQIFIILSRTMTYKFGLQGSNDEKCIFFRFFSRNNRDISKHSSRTKIDILKDMHRYLSDLFQEPNLSFSRSFDQRRRIPKKWCLKKNQTIFRDQKPQRLDFLM